VDAQDTYFQVFNQRIRDFCVNPHTGALYMALNGSSYPGSGPNIIKEFRNLAYTNTSVLNHEPEQNIVVYPNPVSNELSLNFSATFMGSTLEVINFNGQVVNTSLVNNATMKWDVQDWAAGNYFVRCSSPKGTVTKTFVVSH
jgi:hypothetical protein